MAQVTATRVYRIDVPRPVRKALGRLDRRLRALAAVRGLGTAAVVAAAGAAAGMAVDLGWGLNGVARWGVWLAWVAAALTPLAVGLARGLAGKTRALELAAVLERVYPELGERLTGAVGLLGEGDGPAHGSPVLIAALADDASAHAGGLDPAHAAPAGGPWRRLALGLTAVALVAAPGVVRPDPYAGLARRFLMPWAGVGRVGLYAVSVTPGDAVMALGDDLTVTARVAPRFGRSPVGGGAWLEWSEVATGRSRRIAMGPREGEGDPQSGAKGFALVLPRVSGPLTYRVVSGSGESRRYRVDAVPPPAVSAVAARVEPPAYTRLPAADARDPARVEAWEGSRVILTVATGTPVAAAEVSWPRAVPEGAKAEARRVAAEVAPGGRSAKVVLSADASGEYAVALRDAHGLSNRAEPPRRVVVRPDGPPLVAVRGADGLDQARADDTLRVGVAARDDLAVATAELHYTVERAASAASEAPAGDAGHVALPLAGLGTRSARGEAALGLKALGLKPGDVVVYRVRVTDNRPAPRGPNVAWSGPRRLTIVEKAEPLAARRDRLGREEIQAKLDALKKASAENRHETELLRYAADAVQRGNGEWDRDRRRALGGREAEARAVAENLEKLAADLADTPAFRPLARPARQVAEVEAEAARATLDQARQADDAAKRLADLRQADSRLAAVSTRLEELQRGLNALAEREADRRRLQALADRQAEVADKADADKDRDAPDRARLDRVAAEENAVRKDLDDLLKKSPDLRADVLAAQAEEAEALARRARSVAERQRAESRDATDLSKKAVALKALAEEQRAVEEDARRLALDVDSPLAEAGRGRLNTEPLRQSVEPIERGDLDQGRQQLNGAEAELRRLARDLEDAPGDLKALARRLAQRQEKLSGEVIEALGEARNKKDLPADERAALAARLKPLAESQKAVAKIAAAVLDTKEARAEKSEPKFPRDAAEKAAAITARAAEAVATADSPRETEQQAHAARAALQRLANELPDAWRRREPVQRALAEAKRDADEAAREAERHVRETDRPNDRDPAKTAADLARRLEPVAGKARQAADKLAAIEPGSRLEPQRDRAARRARALADAVDAARAPGPPDDEPRARRDAVAAAAVATRAALDRFEQKFHGTTPADDVADELAGEQRALTTDKPAPGLADEQRRLAAALRGLQAPDAALEQAEAVRLAERAARDGGAEAVRRAAEATGALADRLADRQTPRGRAEALARAERGLNDPGAPPDPAVEAARQRAVAAELTRLVTADPDKAQGKAADAASAAVRRAGELAEHAQHPERHPGDPANPTPAQQAEARSKAAAALDTLAAGLPGGAGEDQNHEKGKGQEKEEAPRDPELTLDPEHAARARELARRERRVRERLQAVLGEHVGPQQDVRRESVGVGRELADLRDRARGLSDRARGPADEAAAMLGQHAPRSMDEAATHLAQGQAGQARDTQRRAAELAERGAQNAEDLATALRADSAAAQPATGPARGADAQPGALADARDALNQAAHQLGQARGAAPDPAAMNSARQAMRAAAERLQAAADAKAQGPGDPADGPGEGGQPLAHSPAPSTAEPNGGRAGVADPATLAGLQELVRTKTGRRWGELPGHLRSEILQMSQGRYRDEYARLIRLYFREIAAGAGQDVNP